MALQGMATMKTTVEPVSGERSRVYRFKSKPTMKRGGRFSLRAKVHGASGACKNRLIPKASS